MIKTLNFNGFTCHEHGFDIHVQCANEDWIPHRDQLLLRQHQRDMHGGSVPSWVHYMPYLPMADNIGNLDQARRFGRTSMFDADRVTESAMVQKTNQSSIAYVTPGSRAIERRSMHDWMLNPRNHDIFFADTNGMA
jgi:hypothetical protein